MRCTNCGTELIPGKKFCHACGTRVVQTCAHCGASVEPAFRFCPDCGTPLQATASAPGASPASTTESGLGRHVEQMPEGLAEKIRASKETIEGERKQVTVLFCDLVGSTAMAEKLDPEDYHDLLERYMEIAFREIYRFEGIVNQLAGDGMMALFGAPVAHEDAPQRAVHAALAIRDALATFNEQLRAERGIEMRARFGINTGPVVVGTVGNDLKMDYTAIGDTTNLAARLESLAEPETILVSEATFRLVRGLFEVSEVGPFTVKGKSEPVLAYHILAQGKATTPMAIAAERGLTPFVGRHDELMQLQNCFARLTGNLAQVVAVVGEAGLGKSRLIYEFKQWLAGQSAVVFEARCSALNQMVPYAPWAAMLRTYFDLLPDDSPSVACGKVAQKVREWDPDLSEIFPAACHILSLPVDAGALSPDDEKRTTFEAMARLVVSESLRAPVVMIIEDLHWMDDPSIEMLDRAVAELKGRMMLAVTHRPDYQQQWRTMAALTQLRLRRLSDEDAARIIRALAGAPLPVELEGLILAKAEGSPFFSEEIMRTLLEGGYLERENGHHRLTRPFEEVRIPGTVQEVIAARLDRLGSDAKRVLQVASVLGRQFSRDQLMQLLGPDGIDVVRELDELERRGVIHRKNLFSNDEFRFGESLTQDVAYEGLLLKQRRQLHERIGLLLEAKGGEGTPERSALLAHHFMRSDNREKGIAALLHAAADAERVPSYRTAARFYREAWDLADQVNAPDNASEKQMLAAALGLCRMTVIYNAVVNAGVDDVERISVRARDIATRLGDSPTVVGLSVYHGMIMMNTRERFARGLALIEEGLGVAQRTGMALPSMSRGLAWGYLLDGRFALAQRTIDWAVSEFERQGDHERLSDVYLGTRYMRTRVAFYRDELDRALQEAAETYELAVRVNNRTVQAGTALSMGQTHFVRGEYAEAKRWADRSLEMRRIIGTMTSIPTEAGIALGAAVHLGEHDGIPAYLDMIGEDPGASGEVAVGSHLLIDALLAAGDVQRAERLARAASRQAAGRLREMLSAVGLGDVLQRLGPDHWPEAERCYEQAIELSEALGARMLLAAARIGAAELAAGRGDADGCQRQLQQALEICRALGLGRYQARAERLRAGLEMGAEPRV